MSATSVNISELSLEDFNHQVACYHDLFVTDYRQRITPNIQNCIKEISLRINPQFVYDQEIEWNTVKIILADLFAEYMKSNNVQPRLYQDLKI